MILFTYGTLPKFMVENDIPFRILGIGTIQGIKLDDRPWPAIIKPINDYKWDIQGQIIQLDNPTLIHILDEYEGDQYTREITTITLEDNTTIQAHIYWYTLNGTYQKPFCEQI
jgi:gamma-glutamylcyclotransferase (GGCT)/AIG2-like uncharacterized protein YtfP